MEILVRFTGTLGSLAGQTSLDISLGTGATVRDALLALAEVVPPAFTEQVLRPFRGPDPPLTLLLLNRAHLSGPEGLDCVLTEGDILAFVTPMEGG
jgi:molybdopterin converting factor small subunit